MAAVGAEAVAATMTDGGPSNPPEAAPEGAASAARVPRDAGEAAPDGAASVAQPRDSGRTVPETAPRARAAAGKPGPAGLMLGSLGAFFVALAVLAVQVRAGGDPALGPAKPAAERVIVHRVVLRRVVVTRPAPRSSAPAASDASGSVAPSAPAPSAPAPSAPAPAPAAPVATGTS